MLNSLGFAKTPAETRVVVAMSGGVDSSVVAARLKQEGYAVIGITLQLYDHGATFRKGACCAGQDIYDASRVAEHLDIPHYVLNYESRFDDQVIADFADSYARGETPLPCVRCNQTVKFRDLLATARDLGAEALATGHYVERRLGRNGPELVRGADPGRDQSYFLFATTQEQLAFLRFPLGRLTKSETRALAQSFGLPVHNKPDSQDICFVPDGDYAALVKRRRPEAAEPGEIADLDGRVLGHHPGVIHYTIGQRRGLGLGAEVSGGDPLFVIRLEPNRRRVVVGPRRALGRDLVYLKEINWLAPPEITALSCQTKLRSTQPLALAHLTRDAHGGGILRLALPQQGIAPGQAAVFYDGDRLLGGGWIFETGLAGDPEAV